MWINKRYFFEGQKGGNGYTNLQNTNLKPLLGLTNILPNYKIQDRNENNDQGFTKQGLLYYTYNKNDWLYH